MGNIVRMRVAIRGTRSLIQCRFGPEAIPLEKGERTGVAGNDPEEWRRTCMVTPEGQLYIPPTYIFGCLRDGAKHTKKGRGSIQALVAATLQVEEDIILIDRWVPKEGEPKHGPASGPVYIDVAGVRNPNTGSRNVRYRLATAKGWQCMFTLLWDKTIVSREQMKAVLRDSALLVGLADGRSVGYGRFVIVSAEEVPNAEETAAA